MTPHTSISPRTSPAATVLRPFYWYVNWIRTNQENAATLQRLSRTLVMILSDPSNLISMEACWTASKLHAVTNEAIISTDGRRVGTTELLSFFQHAIQEVECLIELVTRRYCGHQRAWNVILILTGVKCILNMCIHHQLFFVSWLWDSVKLSLRRALRNLLSLPRRRRHFLRDITQGKMLAGQRSSARGLIPVGGGRGALRGIVSSGSLRGSVVGPNNTRLVIPRVTSTRRHEHRHCAVAGNIDGDADGESQADYLLRVADADEAAAQMEEEEAIPFTWIDILAMMLDVYMLLRPLVLVASARHAFMKRTADTSGIAVPPRPPPPPSTPSPTADGGVAALPTADPMALVTKAVQATYDKTLFSNWPSWATLAGVDLLVALLAQLVRSRRVPVVSICDDGASTPEVTYSPVSSTAGADLGLYPRVNGNDSADGQGGNGQMELNTATSTQVIQTVNVPTIVSRDQQRVKQALRNSMYSFLRDPFFTVVVKQAIHDYLVTGVVSRIPLIGSIISFQVSYFLAMQHYSFLYTAGQ